MYTIVNTWELILLKPSKSRGKNRQDDVMGNNFPVSQQNAGNQFHNLCFEKEQNNYGWNESYSFTSYLLKLFEVLVFADRTFTD